MWVIFQKSDGKIVSASAASDVEVSKEEALKEVVQGLVGSKNVSEYDAILVKDREQFSNMTRAVNRGTARVRTSSTTGKQDLVDDSPTSSSLVITTSAQQFHPVDNVPLIPADGRTFLVVNLQKVNDRGELLTRKTVDNDTIWLRIDHGSVRENNEEALPIRSVSLMSGVASFRVYSDTARRLATVQMLTANPELQTGGLQVEFT